MFFLSALVIGCAEPVRQTISRPIVAPPLEVETIFGEATIGDDRSKQAAADIKVPNLPHDGPLTLDDCLNLAPRVSSSIDSADQGYVGAMWTRWRAITDFLPTVDTSYGVTHNADPINPMTGARDQWRWTASVSQPLFTGGRNLANYLLSQLGLSTADITRVQAKEDLLLNVKQAFYGILASEKALAVAKTTVVNLSSHLNVARNFFDVGMVPQNQVLQAEVELAKAQQEQTNRERDLTINKARMNILLRRAVDFPIKIKDELGHPRFPLGLDDCLQVGLKDNPEIQLGRVAVESGAKNVDVARSALYPQVNVNYNTNAVGLNSGVNDQTDWNVSATASFNVWSWGKSKADVENSKVRLNQAIDALDGLENNIKLEVTTNYENLVSADRNISVAQKAVAAAAEDLRMVTERYQEQVATNTEVLDAQTRYSEAQYEYFSALYNYNLSWAALERTMGRRVTTVGLVELPANRPSFKVRDINLP
ncbi:MAG: TolC family protein [Deltaproteobacteria bacterium]|nr:TolC family protein [Deltaproteobacteria bacterium]